MERSEISVGESELAKSETEENDTEESDHYEYYNCSERFARSAVLLDRPSSISACRFGRKSQHSAINISEH